MTDARVVTGLLAVVLIPAGITAYIVCVEWLLKLVPRRLQLPLRPWLWLFPATAFISVFLVYPALRTVVISFTDSTGFGLSHYQYFFGAAATLQALRNNAIWLILLPTLTVGGGLLVAVLFDRVRYENAAKALFFMPMAVSFVGAGVIWKFMLDYRPPGAIQTGTLNAALGGVGLEPIPWLINTPLNTVVLIVVAAWIWTGFCMVVLSASLKLVNPELLDAGRVDGASETQLFRHVTLPLLRPTIGILATLMIISALKAFDIVYVMTNGSFDTEVIANRMIKELFTFNQPGRAAAVAVILLVLIIPAAVIHVRQIRYEL